jgi:hypothetical protein
MTFDGLLDLSEIVGEESIEAIVESRVKPPDDGGRAMLPAFLIPLNRLLFRAGHRQEAARLSGQGPFPLAPRMVLVLTDLRLIVIARTGRKFRDVGDVLASVPRPDIVGASRPTVGGVWRTVLLDLASGTTVTVQVAGSGAEDLVAALTGSAPAGGTDSLDA